jgi:hypothetical protein
LLIEILDCKLKIETTNLFSSIYYEEYKTQYSIFQNQKRQETAAGLSIDYNWLHTITPPNHDIFSPYRNFGAIPYPTILPFSSEFDFQNNSPFHRSASHFNRDTWF